MIDAGVKLLRDIENLGPYEAYIVGGAVRAKELGMSVEDVDITTNCPISVLETKFETFPIGKSKNFGLTMVKAHGEVFEVAEFRSNGKYCEENDAADTIEEDLTHRDFTINTLLVDSNGDTIDMLGAKQDLQNWAIRAVGDGYARILEDPIRIMRAIRFSVRLGFKIDSDLSEAIEENSDLLLHVAPERINGELCKMAKSGWSLAESIEKMEDFGVLLYVSPLLHRLSGLPHREEYHPEGDVFEHTMAALRAGESDDPQINYCILFHDIGKATTLDGEGRYLGHGGVGAELIRDKLRRRLMLSGGLTEAMAYCSKEHMRVMSIVKDSKLVPIVSHWAWRMLKDVMFADLASRELMSEDKIVHMIECIEARAKEWVEKTDHGDKPLVSGHRIMKVCGVSEGPDVGEIQEKVSEWVIDNEIDLTDSVTIDQKLIEIWDRI